MSYQIEFSRRAEKELKQLPRLGKARSLLGLVL